MEAGTPPPTGTGRFRREDDPQIGYDDSLYRIILELLN